MTGLSVYLVTLSTVASTPAAHADAVVLEFSASWCAPCQKMAPLVGKLIRAGKPIRSVDIDEQPQLARRYKVRSLPTFVLLVQGRETDRVVGMMSQQHLQQWFASMPAAAVQDAGANKHGSRPAAGPRRIVRANNDSVNEIASRSSLLSSVRLRVRDAKGMNYGSGTILESRPDRTLILTCGHIFRAMDKAAKVDVELFADSRLQKFVGRLVDFDLNSDLGLVAIYPEKRMPVSKIAAAAVAKDGAVYSIGCGGGEAPTIAHARVTALNRYLGPDNIECTGVPIQGRSGGGLFNKDHRLIGVCIAADPKDKRGLYAGLGAIHQLLQRLDLAHLYQPRATTAAGVPQIAAADKPATAPVKSATRNVPSQLRATSHVQQRSDDRAAEIRRALMDSAQAEVVCIIRPLRGSGDASRVIILNRASEKFVQYLSAEMRSQPQPTMRSIPHSELDVPKWATERPRATQATRFQNGQPPQRSPQTPRRYQRSSANH